MSTVAVKILDDIIELACDNQVTYGNQKCDFNLMPEEGFNSLGKIFSFNQISFGCTGHLTIINLFKLYLKENPLDTKKADRLYIYQYMKGFIEKFMNETIKVEKPEFACIIIFNNIVVKSDLFASVHVIKNYDAIGSGREFALGALATGVTVETAIKAAGKHDMYTNKEVKIIKVKK